jgi:chromosome partitioning protein
MTKIYMCGNKKGGVGRTTTAINLGSLLAAVYGKRVLIIDWDPDRCMTDGLAGGAFEAHQANKLNVLDCMANIKEGFLGAIIPYDLSTYISATQQMAAMIGIEWNPNGQIAIVAGSEDLSEAPTHFAQMRQPVATFEQSLHWMLRQPNVTDNWDIVIIDNSPGWDIVAKTALFAADEAIIPVQPASLAIEAFKRHNLRIQRGNADRKKAGLEGQTTIRGVLISQINLESSIHQQFAVGMRKMFANGNIPCFQTMIPLSDAILVAMYEHAPAWGKYLISIWLGS